MNKSSFFIVGQHAVIEALRNPKRKVLRVFLPEESKKNIHRKNPNKNILEDVKVDFKSKKDQWQEVNLSIKDFIATWRGFTYSDYPAPDIEKISELGIQISDKQEGDFNLEIEYIKAMY